MYYINVIYFVVQDSNIDYKGHLADADDPINVLMIFHYQQFTFRVCLPVVTANLSHITSPNIPKN